MISSSSEVELVGAIFSEVIAAQEREFERVDNSPIPFSLWPGDGQFFKASRKTYDLIHQFADRKIELDSGLTRRYRYSEISDVIAKAVAQIFTETDINEINGASGESLLRKLELKLSQCLNEMERPATYVFGCSLLADYGSLSLRIGPVAFEAKEVWLQRCTDEGLIDHVTERRFKARWTGKKLRSRADPQVEASERHLLEAIDRSLVVCSVLTGSQSAKAGEPKALQAGRLAMTAIALMWQRPSKVLNSMSLNPDQAARSSCYAKTTDWSFVGASYSASSMRNGTYAGEDFDKALGEFEHLFGPVAEAVSHFVDPDFATNRPKVLNRLNMGLWYFHDACREKSDLIAISKFASCLDALASGKRARGIRKLIEHRLNRKPQDQWLKDGRSPYELVDHIYSKSRNPISHGVVEDLDRDRSQTRQISEFVARQSLVGALEWMDSNPNEPDPKKMIEAS